MAEINLSSEEKTRIGIWSSILGKACDYLVVCEIAYSKLNTQTQDLLSDVGEYNIGDSTRSYFSQRVIEKGLSEAAVVALFTVENVISLFSARRNNKNERNGYLH